MLNKWEGIVFRTIPYGESNKIVTLFTREAGKVTAMARGAKKPRSKLAAVTQPFTHGSFLIRKGRGMGHFIKVNQLIRCGLFVKILKRLHMPVMLLKL